MNQIEDPLVLTKKHHSPNKSCSLDDVNFKILLPQWIQSESNTKLGKTFE